MRLTRSAMFARGALLLYILLLRMTIVVSCPRGCSCQKLKGSQKLRASCNGLSFKKIMDPNSLKNVSYLDLSSNEITTIQSRAFGAHKTLKKLYLTRNKITSLKQGAFMGLSKLKELDIAHNDLLTLNGEPFKGLRSLRRLDLSYNNLNFINGTVFQGLRKLRELILSYNKFIIIPEATLKPLRSLSSLNLISNRMLCDCHVKWLLTSKKLNKKALKGTCRYPEPLKDKKLTQISAKNLQCASLRLPYYEFKPNNDEVAIQGDGFMFTCGTTWIPVLRINWFKDNHLLRPDVFKPHIVIDFKANLQAGRIVSTLKIKKLDIGDTGVYRCTVSSDKISVSGESLLQVLPGGSKFCHSEVTKTVKGVFHWDNIALGGVSRLPCPAGVLPGIGKVKGFAYRNCGKDGVWRDVEGTECAYVDKVTQELYHLKQRPVNSTTVFDICNSLYTLTENATSIKSDIDVSYAASILESVKVFLGANEQVGKIVVHIISNMMNVREDILAEAQMRSKACSSFILVLDVLANANVVGTKFISSNVGMSLVPVYPATFQGSTCASYLDNKYHLNSVSCNLVWKNVTTFSPSKPIEVSVHLPKSLFSGQRIPPITQLKLTFTVFRNSRLFPHLRNGSLVENPRVATSVVSLRLGTQLNNLSEPIAIKYRNQQQSDKTPPISVYWDQTRKGGIESWVQNKDCTLSKSENSTIMYCYKLTDKNYFAVIMSVEKSMSASSKSDQVLTLSVVVYVGATLCTVLLLVTLITYAVFRKLRYNRDDAAMLMNLCLALLVTVILFVVGIHRVTNTLMCRAVGVLLHYFILCSLLWVGCGALCLCRLLRTAVIPEEFNPVLRYYMISWGIPLIICGITVAGNPDNYSVQKYCWLEPNPFLGAFVGPACLVILVDIILYIRLNNLIYNTYNTLENGGTSDEDEENVAVASDELAPDQIASKCELLQRLHEVLPEKKDILVYQKGSLLVMLLIVINFVLGFLLVKFQQPKSLYLLLSCAYALANIMLGIIVFLFHCLKNSKAKQFWKDYCSKCLFKKKYLVDQEIVPNTDSTEDKRSTSLLNGDTVRDNGVPLSAVIPRIYGAPSTPLGSDIQSNVSLPSSAVLTISVNNLMNPPKPGAVVNNAPNTPNAGSPPGSVTTSMSDRQSCVSAPLPLSHAQPEVAILPQRYSYTFADTEKKKKKKKKTKVSAPLALPDRNAISSSMESNLKAKYEGRLHFPTRPPDRPEIAPEKGIQESAPSEMSSVREPSSYLETPVPYSSCASSDISLPTPCSFQSRPPIPGAPDVRNFGPGTVGQPGTFSAPHNNYPRPVYVPVNFDHPGDPSMRLRNSNYASYPKTIPEERYVSLPKRPNGFIGRKPSDTEHVYESIDEPQQNGQQFPTPNFVPQTTAPEQNGTSKPPENDNTDTENTSLLGPPQGPHLTNQPPSDQHLPRRKPRERRNRDKSRTRRYRDGGSHGRRRDPSSRSGAPRSSATSLKSDRVKPEPKEWIPDPTPQWAYVPVPHLTSKEEDRNETSV